MRMQRPGLVLWILAVGGCQREPVGQIPAPGFPASLPLSRPERTERGDLPAVVHANNAFAMKLYQGLRSRPGNLLVSPACLTAGLALTHTGARGETARQIARVMHRPDGPGEPGRAYAALIHGLNADAEDRSYQVRLANAVWVQHGYPLRSAYLATLRESFALEDNRVDFRGEPEHACRLINAWTETRTGGKVVGMLEPAKLPTHTRMVLTSALYLRANWRSRFRREATRQETFHVERSKGVKVAMMNEHSYLTVYSYYDGGPFQVLELPCGSQGELGMMVILPRETYGLAALEAALTLEAFESWLPRFRKPEEIVVALPKFRIRAELSLDRTLADMGMPLAFQPDADFSGINGKTQDLFLGAARHSTLVDVHEEGIEAASSADYISPDSFGEEPPVVRADHPFVFLIRDTRTGCILFMGRVANPLEQGDEVTVPEKSRKGQKQRLRAG